jgi:superfamily I DNA/RNA helicase
MIEHVTKSAKLPDGYVTGMDIRSPWFRNELVPAFGRSIHAVPEKDQFDVLIVDEGQDIINLDYLAVLDPLVRGGLQSGIWRIFFDPNQQSGISDLFEKDALDFLRSLGPVPPRLTKNCRNTNQIVLQTYLHTGADLKAEGAGPGPEVSIIYYQSVDDEATRLETLLREMQSQQISAGDITILSPLSWVDSSARRMKQPQLSRIKVLRGSLQEDFPDSRTTFAATFDFKGLENRFVILTDITDLDSCHSAISNIYIGMTRARVKLWLLVHESLRRRHEEITISNIKRMNERVHQ